MSHKRSKKKREGLSVLDDPKKWSTEIRPPFFDRQTFQMRLDLRAGKNKDAKSVLVLRWAPEVFTEIFDEKMPRYWVSRVKNGESWLYTSPPRWVIERRLEKEQYADSWNKTRWVPLPDGTFLDKGAPPEDYHIFTWLCAEHESVNPENGQPRCCDRAWQDGRKRCWGIFRSPNELDLQCVEAAVRRREGEHFVDPYAPLDQHELEMIEAASGAQIEREAMEMEKRQMEILRDVRTLSEIGISSYDIGSSFEKAQNKPLIHTLN